MVEATTRLIRKTFSTVTPESAVDGEDADRGWIDEDGTPITPDEYDVEEHGSESAAAVALAVKLIRDEGGVEASDYPRCSHGHTWYTTVDPDRDYRTGAETTYSFHLVGFTA